LCASQLQASQSTNSAVSPLAEQPAEQEQIFASNATQDNIILKPSKYNFEESFENSSSEEKKKVKVL
jgi:phosphopantothenoylcysteine synthetase/decarboxylase